MNKELLKFAAFSIFTVFILLSCEDPVPNTYEEAFMTEALLINGRPIEGISILRSAPVLDSFDYDKNLIRNADVRIYKGDEEFKLEFSEEQPKGYHYPGLYTVEPATEYRLKVILNNGEEITGTTTTPPDSLRWSTMPSHPIQYPKDLNNAPLGDTISWEELPGYPFYIISIIPLDTLEYGKYLEPPTDEMNERVKRPRANERQYLERSSYAVVPNNKTPIVWPVFKWYGLHEIAVYAPDNNFFRWFIQNVGSGQITSLLTSLEGGIGYFGSATVIRDTSFLKKPIE